MSAPLVVNTNDGAVWTRRDGSRDGEALYAPEKCGTCPQFVMVTLTELAELGIVGSADVLPVPVVPEPQRVDAGPVVLPFVLAGAQLDALAASGNRAVNDAVHEDLCACDAWPEQCLSSGGFFQGYWDMGGLETAIPAVLGLWERMRGGELVALQARIAELEAQRERRRARLVALQNDALSMRGSLSPMGEDRKVPFPLGETLTPAVDWLIGRVAELEARPSPADVLRQAADDLTAACPDHGDADEAWMDCPCEFADELRRKAALAGSGDDVAGCPCPPADRPHQVGCPLAEVPAALFPTVASLREPEGEFHAYLHHENRVGHDLPETGGLSVRTAREDDDPARCLKVHPFSPRDGWRMVCGNCDHGKDADCHQVGA